MAGLEFSFDDAVFWVTTSGLQIVIGIVSFRRSRFLSHYPLWQSVVIGFLSGCFMLIWLLNWAANRKDIAEDWNRYRESREGDPAELM